MPTERAEYTGEGGEENFCYERQDGDLSAHPQHGRRDIPDGTPWQWGSERSERNKGDRDLGSCRNVGGGRGKEERGGRWKRKRGEEGGEAR
eukprot:768080-Hanusia_phi.AAC.5